MNWLKLALKNLFLLIGAGIGTFFEGAILASLGATLGYKIDALLDGRDPWREGGEGSTILLPGSDLKLGERLIVSAPGVIFWVVYLYLCGLYILLLISFLWFESWILGSNRFLAIDQLIGPLYVLIETLYPSYAIDRTSFTDHAYFITLSGIFLILPFAAFSFSFRVTKIQLDAPVAEDNHLARIRIRRRARQLYLVMGISSLLYVVPLEGFFVNSLDLNHYQATSYRCAFTLFLALALVMLSLPTDRAPKHRTG